MESFLSNTFPTFVVALSPVGFYTILHGGEDPNEEKAGGSQFVINNLKFIFTKI